MVTSGVFIVNLKSISDFFAVSLLLILRKYFPTGIGGIDFLVFCHVEAC